MGPSLVAGIDSSTQSCKVVVRDATTGALVRSGRAPHPDGTEVDPAAWEVALTAAIADAGGLDDVGAVSVGGQQHGMVLLDESGDVVRPALLWNDTRSAGAASDLVAELGAEVWADATGSVPVASFTVTKLRWTAQHDEASAARATAVCLPHDWLTRRLRGGGLTTDRGDASGTGYWSPTAGEYRTDLLVGAFGRELEVPAVASPWESVGEVEARWGAAPGTLLAPGTGDNMAAALGLGAQPGDVVVSLGTSGTAFAVSETSTHDVSGAVAGFADATGRFLPLVCTLNAAQVLDVAARMLGVDHDGFARLALSAAPGADGLVLLPYLAGERTPNRPDATGVLAGMTLANTTPANLARAAVEGMLCGLADAVDALEALGVPVGRVLIIGGAAKNPAVAEAAPRVFGRPVFLAEPGEYVADGAARQAAQVLAGGSADVHWPEASGRWVEADPTPHVREAYAALREATAP
ncbi:xylulokinase [Longivirga aurantiaca]|uniref:Xylulose kinase n=1 Tax=Longivirga aurantiaca TaxID=1837743 RepID=A0ABW1SVI5_9ACTN